MKELYEKIDILMEELNNTNCIQRLKALYKKIEQDKKIIDLIEKYQYTQDERIRSQLLENNLVREYKHQEAELNFLILEINQKLKKITKRNKCGL